MRTVSNINTILHIKKDKKGSDLTKSLTFYDTGKHRTIKPKWIVFPGTRIRTRIILVAGYKRSRQNTILLD